MSATSTSPDCSPDDPSHHRLRAPLVDDRSLDRAARLFRAIGEVSRLRLISLLAQGEACVTELAAAEHEGLSTISQRLRILRAENIVVRRRRGKHINYALADQHMAELIFNALAHATELAPTAVFPPTQGELSAFRRNAND